MKNRQAMHSQRVIVGRSQPTAEFVAITGARQQDDGDARANRSASLDMMTLLPRVPVVGALAAWALQGWQRDFMPRHYVPSNRGLERPRH